MPQLPGQDDAFLSHVTAVSAGTWHYADPCRPLQPVQGSRVKEKFVSLPEELEQQAVPDLPSTVFEVWRLHEHCTRLPVCSAALSANRFMHTVDDDATSAVVLASASAPA